MSKKPVPKKKQAVSSTRSRNSKYVYLQRKKLTNQAALGKCSNCGATKRAHFVCNDCGFYNGREVLKEQESKTVTTEIKA